MVAQFTSAAVGMAVAIALIRGLARSGSDTIGNFWVDLVRGSLYVLVPIALVTGLIFAAQGAVETFAGRCPFTTLSMGCDKSCPGARRLPWRR
jgi:K+-transporting ATPase ATPase A chain